MIRKRQISGKGPRYGRTSQRPGTKQIRKIVFQPQRETPRSKEEARECEAIAPLMTGYALVFYCKVSSNGLRRTKPFMEHDIN